MMPEHSAIRTSNYDQNVNENTAFSAFMQNFDLVLI